jgi:DNA repair exonuclease SbcCD ATPase subunit
MRIIFKRCRWKNILSTGAEFSEIDFTVAPLNLIRGKNGAGKSTIYEALTFGIFGRPFSKFDGKTSIINCLNNGGALVEVEFSAGGHEYMIRRGMKPTILEVYKDGEMMNQPASVIVFQKYIEENVICLNFHAFSQIVVLGYAGASGYVPFMRLPADQRREVVEEILGLRVFSTMAEIVKRDAAARAADTRDQRAEIALKETRRQAVENTVRRITALTAQNSDADIARLEGEVETARRAAKEAHAALAAVPWSEDHEDQRTVAARADGELYQLAIKLRAKFDELDRIARFFAGNDTCPTCDQPITGDHKARKAAHFTGQREQIAAGMSMAEQRRAAVALDRTRLDTQLREWQTRRQQSDTLFEELHRQQASLRWRAEAAEAQVPDVQMDLKEIEDLTAEITGLETVLHEKIETEELYTISLKLLKDDGLKARLINEYIPVINELIAKYLVALEFYTGFVLDSTFTETVTSVDKGKFTYCNFSAGEKQRVDIAIMVMWRDIAEIRSSVSTNLLFLDEVLDASMEGEGVELFLNLVSQRWRDSNVFIISHRGDEFASRFDRIIRVTKPGNFSHLEDENEREN